MVFGYKIAKLCCLAVLFTMTNTRNEISSIRKSIAGNIDHTTQCSTKFTSQYITNSANSVFCCSSVKPKRAMVCIHPFFGRSIESG